MRRFRFGLCMAFAVTLTVTSPRPAAAACPPEAAVDEVALPRRTASRLGVKAGQVLEISARPDMRGVRCARVAVIWDPEEHPADVARGELQVRFHLPTLESLLERDDVIDRLVVRLRDPSLAAAVRDDLNALELGIDAYAAGELVRHTSRTFLVISRFHRAIALITLLASGIFLMTIMALKLSEMRREIGALRLLGIGQGTIAAAILAIAGFVALAGSGGGVAIGALMVHGINAYYGPRFDTSLRFAALVPETVFLAMSLAVALGLGTGAVVALRLLRQRPLEQVGR